MKKLALLTLAIFFSVVLSAQIQIVKSYSIANSNTQIGAILPAGTNIYNVADDVNYRLLIPSVATYTLNTAGFAERVDDYAIGLTETNADSLALHLDTLQAHSVLINTNLTNIATNADSLAVHLDTLQAHNTAINLKAPKASPTFTGTVTTGDISGSSGDAMLGLSSSEVTLGTLEAAAWGFYCIPNYAKMNSYGTAIVSAPERVSIGDVEGIFNNTKIDVITLDNEITLTADLTTITGTVSASNLSGTNTGDQDLSPYAPLASPTFTGTVTTGDISGSSGDAMLGLSSSEVTLGTLEAATWGFYCIPTSAKMNSYGTAIVSAPERVSIGDVEGIFNNTYIDIIALDNEITLTAALTTITGIATAAQYKLSALNTAPASAGATGNLGEMRVTASYIYVCTATNTWVRSPLATW